MPLLPRHRSTLDLLSTDLRQKGAERDANKSPTPNQHEPFRSTSRPLSEYGLPTTTSLQDLQSHSSPTQDPTPATKRFSMLKFRHFSETNLSARAKAQAEQDNRPPVPSLPGGQPAPAIFTTAPTFEMPMEKPAKKSRMMPFRRKSSKPGPPLLESPGKMSPRRSFDKDRSTASRAVLPWRKSQDQRRDGEHRLSIVSTNNLQLSPQRSPSLAPTPRNLSDSDRSRNSAEKVAATSTRSSLFKVPGRNKRKSLFPLPIKIQPPPEYPDTAPATPRASTSAVSARSLNLSPAHLDSPRTTLARSHTEILSAPDNAISGPVSKSTVTFAPRGGPLLRNDSSHSTQSARSSPVGIPPRHLGIRDRASTMSTFDRASDGNTPPTPPTIGGSARNSTSTSGRASLGNFLTRGRFRNGSDANGQRYDSPGVNSKSNSFAISRESFNLPERQEGENAAKYLERLQNSMSRSVIAGVLSKSADPFFQAVLRSYTRRFAFFGEPIDMSLRKFLLEAELPKETQQVDRVIQAFADRYHECNPGLFLSPDQAYIVAFSLMMLHTDAFNKNNKHKMQKADYIKNTRGQDVSEDVLACFYDNICYTPFIHFDEDEFDVTSDRLSAHKSKKAKLKGAMVDPTKKPSGPVDPYSLIIDSKLDMLRPSIKDSILLDDPYNYKVTDLDPTKIQRTFKNTGILQIVSARSRPAAFESQATRDNPQGSKPGVVDIQVTKVGVLWRKSAKRKKARSPWQEWGAILTGAQLYFFRNASWVKTLMQQHSNHQRHAVPPSPVVFRPPLEDFRPDSLAKIDDAVALVDSSYTRHKNAFTLVRQNSEEEVFLADNDSELHEWITLINYAAAFRSAGVRIRGFIGTDGVPQPGGLKRLDSTNTIRSVKSQRSDSGGHQNNMNPQLARQILALRRKQMIQKIAEAELKLGDMHKRLESMLRNARHLLVLSPIQPRTREVVCHAAARMDAMLKWTRRDIWRIRCYEEILAMDALEDPEDVVNQSSRLRPLSMIPDMGKENAHLLSSQEVPAIAAASPPETPISPVSPAHARTISSAETTFMDDDVFKTPPESARQSHPPGDWALPPVQLNPGQPQRRPSGSSMAPSTQSGHQPSINQLSSTPSVNDISQHLSATTADTALRPSLTPVTSAHKVREGAPAPALTASTGGSIGRRPSDAPSASAVATPESLNKSRSNRRSLHRTLRDVYHEPGSIHRHRKGKDSASTVKTDSEEGVGEITPGLERSQGRFIVHGKQASVITFGSDWAEEKIRMGKREGPDVEKVSEDAAEGGAEAEDDAGVSPLEASSAETNFGTPHTETGESESATILGKSPGSMSIANSISKTPAAALRNGVAVDDEIHEPADYFDAHPSAVMREAKDRKAGLGLECGDDHDVPTPKEEHTVRHIDNDELRELSRRAESEAGQEDRERDGQ